MSTSTGRRERKKQETRKAISNVATLLFVERGFDAVTVAEVAAAADVAVQTVFNHFGAKEDLFFDDLDWVSGPAEAVRAAGSGTPLHQVLAAHFREQLEDMLARGYLPGVVQFTHTLEASPALRARRAHFAEAMEQQLAEAIADGPPDWRSRLRAAQYSAAQKVLNAELVRRLAEQPDGSCAEEVLATVVADADEAFAVLAGRQHADRPGILGELPDGRQGDT